MPDTSTLPRWDATALFPSLESRQLAAAHEAVAADVARLVALHDRHGVDETEPHEPSAEEIQAFEEVLAATNAVAADLLRLQVYVLSFVSTDSRNDAGQALFSELDRHDATMRQLSARFTAWVAALGPTALASVSALGADHAYVLDRAGARAEHQMGPEEESLYAELRVSGSGAWARLHSDVTSQLLATIVRPGRHDRAASDHHGARAGDRPRRRGAPGGLRRRAGGLADGGGAPRRGDERHQGRGQLGERPPGLERPARRVPVRQQRRPRARSRPCSRRSSTRSPTSGGTCGPRPACWATRAAWRGGTCSPRRARRPGRCSWSRGTEIVRRAFGGYSTGAGRHGRARLRRAVGRRRAAAGQARRRLLHAVLRRPVARAS